MGRQHWDRIEPLSTVVSILVNWDVNPVHWENPQNLIKNVLRSYNLRDVGVVFSRGEVCYNGQYMQAPDQTAPSGQRRLSMMERSNAGLRQPTMKARSSIKKAVPYLPYRVRVDEIN